jgi:hypothetical protein
MNKHMAPDAAVVNAMGVRIVGLPEITAVPEKGLAGPLLVLLATGEKQEPDEVYEKWLPLVRRFSFGDANGPRAESGGRSSMH